MSSVGDRVLDLPCLGRPFRLGMLYDCRTDSIIPGVTFWDSADLKLTEESMQSYQPSSSFELIAEDSLNDKTFHLGVEASLALSFMSGMVSVSGSAKYLSDKKDSKKTSRVTLQFTCTSHFKELSMEQIGNLKYKNDVFGEDDNKQIATHVVTGIVYGADAFFVFDRELEEKEDYQEVHGDMQIAIKSIPNIQIEGKGSLDIKSKEVEESDKFHCKFYGDILLPENPTTFKGAVKVYQTLPELIGITSPDTTTDASLEHEDESADREETDSGRMKQPIQHADLMKNLKTVPKTVWLYPLARLLKKTDAIVRSISSRLVGDCTKLLESLHDVQMRTNDLMKSKAFYNFQGIKLQLMQFKDLIAQYETYIMQQLSILLPEIRGGGTEEQKLADLFQSNHDSPFSYFKLVSYLDRKEREIKVLEKCLEFMGKAENDEKLEKQNRDEAASKITDPKEKEPTDDSNTQVKSSIEFAFQTGEMDSVIYSFDHDYVLSFEFANIEREDPFLSSMYQYLKDAENIESVTWESGWYEDTDLIDDMRTKVMRFKRFVKANPQSKKTWFALTDGSSSLKAIKPSEMKDQESSLQGESAEKSETKEKKGAMIFLYEGGKRKEFTPPGRPGKAFGKAVSSSMIFLDWPKPEYGEITHYVVSYCAITDDDSESEEWLDYAESVKTLPVIIKGLERKTKYKFRVRSVCKIGDSEYSETSEAIQTKSTDRLRSLVNSSTLTSAGSSEAYTYHFLKQYSLLDEDNKIASCATGERRSSSKPLRTIVVTGLSPSSRQTMIDMLFNYVFGITWRDSTRFHLSIKENDLNLKKAEWMKIFDIIIYEDDDQEIQIPFSLRIVEMPVGGLKCETNFQQLIKAFDEIEFINYIVLTSDVCTRDVSTTEFVNLCHLLSIYSENVKNLLCLVYTEGDPRSLLQRFAKNSNISLKIKPFKIPYIDFMHPKPGQEASLMKNFEESIGQFFEFIGSEINSRVRTDDIKKVLRNNLAFWKAVFEIHSIHILGPVDTSSKQYKELVDKAKKSSEVIERFHLLQSPTRSTKDIEQCIEEIKPQKSEYLFLKNDLAKLVENIIH